MDGSQVPNGGLFKLNTLYLVVLLKLEEDEEHV